jgi:hypothetical protein
MICVLYTFPEALMISATEYPKDYYERAQDATVY